MDVGLAAAKNQLLSSLLWVLNESYIYKTEPKEISAWHVTLFGNCMAKKKKHRFLRIIRKIFLVFFQFECFSSWPCSFQIKWHVRLKFCLLFFNRPSFHLVLKASWAITYFWLQLSNTYTYSYTRCFGWSLITFQQFKMDHDPLKLSATCFKYFYTLTVNQMKIVVFFAIKWIRSLDLSNSNQSQL